MPYRHLVRVHDALLPAAFSGLINAVTAWFDFRGEPSIPLSVDNISSTQVTVWSHGVSLAFSLGIVLTCIGVLKFRKTAVKQEPAVAPLVNRAFFPFVLGLALQNAFMLFGILVVVAVLWQRLAGTVHVSSAVAAILVGALAMAVAAVTEIRTKRGMLSVPPSRGR
jgi:hypothetical protein